MSSKQTKNLSRRQFFGVAAGAAAGTQLARLSPLSVFPSRSKLSAPARQDTPVTLWGWPTQITRSLDTEGTDLLIPRVLEDTGVQLEVSLVDQADLAPRLRAALPSGTGPDVLATDFDVMGPYWQFMAPLNEFAEAEWGPNWKTELFSPTAVQEMDLVSQIVGRPDEVFYLPGNMQLLGWPYYWIEDFETHDIDVAAMTTFDDFIAACQKLKDAGLVAMRGSGHPAELADWFKVLVEVAAPGKMADVQRGIGSFTDPDMAETFNLIAMMYNEYMQEGAIAEDAGVSFNGFFAHESSMVYTFAGTPYFGFLNGDNEQVREDMRNSFGTFQIPGAAGLASTDGGMAMIEASQNKAAAWEFIKWATVGNGAAYTARDTSSPYGAVAITPALTGTDFDTNLAGPLFDALQSGNNVFRRVLCADVYSAITTTIPGVVTGQISAADAAAEVQEAFERNCEQWVTS